MDPQTRSLLEQAEKALDGAAASARAMGCDHEADSCEAHAAMIRSHLATAPATTVDVEELASIVLAESPRTAPHDDSVLDREDAKRIALAVLRHAVGPLMAAREKHAAACERVERTPKRELSDAEIAEADDAIREQVRTHDAVLTAVDKLVEVCR